MQHPKSAILHGCFSRFAGDTWQATDFHSLEWTLVRNNRSVGNEKRISKSNFGICVQTIPKRKEVNFEVTPKESELTYLRIGNHQQKSSGKMK
jgi:hypothetical protein